MAVIATGVPRLPSGPRSLGAGPASSAAWGRYFRANAARLLVVPWVRGAELTDAERAAIAASVRVFQQGESQEGGHFFRCVRAYAGRTGDWAYVETHRLFMEEERRHGRDLGRFLVSAGVPLLTEQSWLTRGFCWGGSRGGLETTLRIILFSEVIAQVYYAALRRATGSAVLRRLCVQILRDEKAHVRFQCERLALMRARRRGWRLALSHCLDGALFVGAGLAAWAGHRRALRAGGLGFVGFWREAFRKFALAAMQKDPRRRM